MTVSIIICTRNRGSSLAQTLDSLAKLPIPSGLECELWVVDNGSSDGTREVVQKRIASHSWFRYVLEPVPGQARARNLGISKSTGKIIIFTDDDVRFDESWLAAMCDPILQGSAQAVAGQVKLAPELERDWMAPRHRSWYASTDRLDLRDPSDMVGASMAFHRSVLERVPGFDNELGPGALGFGDDTLFSWQIKQAGFRLVGAPKAQVIHHFQTDRLLRKNWLGAAERMAKSTAYINYHWLHQAPTQPHVRLLRAYSEYGFWRTVKRRDCSAAEGIPLWEMLLVERIHRLREHLALSKRPRNYEKHGLIKRNSH